MNKDEGSDECDECRGQGYYFIDNQRRECICSEPQYSPCFACDMRDKASYIAEMWTVNKHGIDHKCDELGDICLETGCIADAIRALKCPHHDTK